MKLNLKHVIQTKMTYPDGNCFAACISMITSIPLEEIPNFASYTEENGNWWKDISDWLAPRGWGGVMITDKAMEENKADFYGARITGIPFILTGKSPGGDWNHCVVQWEEEGELLQLDPHPRNKGVVEPLADVILLLPFKAFIK